MLPPFVPPSARAQSELLPLITEFVIERGENSPAEQARAAAGPPWASGSGGEEQEEQLPSIQEFVWQFAGATGAPAGEPPRPFSVAHADDPRPQNAQPQNEQPGEGANGGTADSNEPFAPRYADPELQGNAGPSDALPAQLHGIEVGEGSEAPSELAPGLEREGANAPDRDAEPAEATADLTAPVEDQPSQEPEPEEPAAVVDAAASVPTSDAQEGAIAAEAAPFAELGEHSLKELVPPGAVFNDAAVEPGSGSGWDVAHGPLNERAQTDAEPAREPEPPASEHADVSELRGEAFAGASAETSTDRSSAEGASGVPEGDEWVFAQRDTFNWQSVANLAGPADEARRAEEAWSGTEWERPQGSQDHVAAALVQLARRVRSGELKLDVARNATPEAALAAVLAALLGGSDD